MEIVLIRKPFLGFVNPFLGSAIVALDAGSIATSPVLLFDQPAGGASLNDLSVGFRPTFIEVEQRLLVARRHILMILVEIFVTKPVEYLDELVHTPEINLEATPWI